MPLRAGNAAGGLPDSAILGAIQYACANGARVVNGSFGGTGFSQALFDAISSAACANTLFVFSAGNGGIDGVGDDNDALPQYPCNYATTRIVCVAATNQNDARASFSNFGTTSVDLAAPGVAVYSTIPTFADVAADGFEDTPTLFSTRWGVQVAPTDHPIWGQQTPGAFGTFALGDSPSGDYFANTDSQIRSISGTNLTGRAGCSLGYYMHLETQPGDVFSIYASTAFGGPYTAQAGWTGITEPGFWQFFTELGTFDGKPNVFLLFRLTSNSSGQDDGAQLDNLTFKCLATPPAAGDYRNLNGTSMAAPHVTGAAALVLARNPALTPAQVRTILLATVDPVVGLNVASGGRLNVGSAVASVDVTAPETTIDMGPTGSIADPTPTFAFSSSEAGATFQCRVDDGAFAACSSPPHDGGAGRRRPHVRRSRDRPGRQHGRDPGEPRVHRGHDAAGPSDDRLRPRRDGRGDGRDLRVLEARRARRSSAASTQARSRPARHRPSSQGLRRERTRSSPRDRPGRQHVRRRLARLAGRHAGPERDDHRRPCARRSRSRRRSGSPPRRPARPSGASSTRARGEAASRR